MSVKPSIPEVVERFARYLQRNPSWGSLHIVLDDSSVSDQSVQFCIDWAKDKEDHEGKELAETLLLMSKTQRLKLSSSAYQFMKSHGWADIIE